MSHWRKQLGKLSETLEEASKPDELSDLGRRIDELERQLEKSGLSTRQLTEMAEEAVLRDVQVLRVVSGKFLKSSLREMGVNQATIVDMMQHVGLAVPGAWPAPDRVIVFEDLPAGKRIAIGIKPGPGQLAFLGEFLPPGVTSDGGRWLQQGRSPPQALTEERKPDKRTGIAGTKQAMRDHHRLAQHARRPGGKKW